MIEIRSKEESAADSILRSQEKLREHTAASRPSQSSLPDDCSSLIESSQRLLAYIEKRESSLVLPSFSPPNLKYLESIRSGASTSDEVLEVTNPTSSASRSTPTDLRPNHPPPSTPADNLFQVVPSLSLEDILKENDIPEEFFATEPPSTAAATREPARTQRSVSSLRPTVTSPVKEINHEQPLPEDDLLESLLSESRDSARYLPVAKAAQSDSQYQWASTTPLSEAEYEALRSVLLLFPPHFG
jgi:hypothetical protein